MKKIVFALFFVFSPVVVFSQLVKTKAIIEAPKANKENFDQNEVWLNMYDAFYRIKFEQNPVGVKHLFENLKEILEANNLDINKPFYDRSLLASYVKDLGDYEAINASALTGSTEIAKYWIGNNSTVGRIIVTVNAKEYTILFK